MGPKVAYLADLETPRNKRVPKAPRRARLTVTHIAALKSTREPFAVSDPDCRGLSLHVPAQLADGSTGTKSWHWRFYWRGKRVKLTVGQYPEISQKDAHDRVTKARALLERGIDPRKTTLTQRHSAPAVTNGADGKPVEPHSIEHLAEEFFKRYIRPRLKRPEQVERLITVEVLKPWRTRDARAITSRDVITLLNDIVDRGSPSIANDLGAYLAQMYKFGIQQQLVEANPVQLLFAPGGQEKPRDRALSDKELAALLADLDDVFKRAPITSRVIRIALYTACPRSELALAKWSDLTLDGDAPLWRVPPENSKTDVEYLIPLVPAAVREFQQLKKRAGRSRYVLPTADGDGPIEPRLLTRSVARHLDTLAEHKVEAFTLHDLRRTVRTGLARLKVQAHIAERVLNHAQPGVAAVYDVHTYLEEKRDALDKWAAHLKELQSA
jgi:integrase